MSSLKEKQSNNSTGYDNDKSMSAFSASKAMHYLIQWNVEKKL